MISLIAVIDSSLKKADGIGTRVFKTVVSIQMRKEKKKLKEKK